MIDVLNLKAGAPARQEDWDAIACFGDAQKNIQLSKIGRAHV